MTQLSVTLALTNSNFGFEIELPGDAPVEELLPTLVEQLGLPQTGPNGKPVTFALVNLRTEQECEPTGCLADVGTQSGDMVGLRQSFERGDDPLKVLIRCPEQGREFRLTLPPSTPLTGVLAWCADSLALPAEAAQVYRFTNTRTGREYEAGDSVGQGTESKDELRLARPDLDPTLCRQALEQCGFDSQQAETLLTEIQARLSQEQEAEVPHRVALASALLSSPFGLAFDWRGLICDEFLEPLQEIAQTLEVPFSFQEVGDEDVEASVQIAGRDLPVRYVPVDEASCIRQIARDLQQASGDTLSFHVLSEFDGGDTECFVVLDPARSEALRAETGAAFTEIFTPPSCDADCPAVSVLG